MIKNIGITTVKASSLKVRHKVLALAGDKLFVGKILEIEPATTGINTSTYTLEHVDTGVLIAIDLHLNDEALMVISLQSLFISAVILTVLVWQIVSIIFSGLEALWRAL